MLFLCTHALIHLDFLLPNATGDAEFDDGESSDERVDGEKPRDYAHVEQSRVDETDDGNGEKSSYDAGPFSLAFLHVS